MHGGIEVACLEVWKCGRLEVWQSGSVEVWKCGSFEVWQFGSVVVWKCGSKSPTMELLIVLALTRF